MTRIAGRGKSSSATLAVYLSLFISIHPCLSVLIRGSLLRETSPPLSVYSVYSVVPPSAPICVICGSFFVCFFLGFLGVLAVYLSLFIRCCHPWFSPVGC
jgi:hypothetical protein